MTVSIPKLGAPVAIIPPRAEDPEMNLMVSSIFRRKLLGGGSGSGDRNQSNGNVHGSVIRSNNKKSGARCLFGSPDPKVVIQQANEVQRKAQVAFEKRWGFNCSTDEPMMVADEAQAQGSKVPRFDWKLSSTDDPKIGQRFPNGIPTSVSAASVQTETNSYVTQGTQTPPAAAGSILEDNNNVINSNCLADYDLYLVARKRKASQSAPIPIQMKKKERHLSLILPSGSPPPPTNMINLDSPILYNCVKSSSLESMTGEELMEIHHNHHNQEYDQELSPGLGSPSLLLDENEHLNININNNRLLRHSSPGVAATGRIRASGGVFVFPESTAYEFQALRIRNHGGSSSMSSSGSVAVAIGNENETNNHNRCWTETKRMKQRSITDYMQVKKSKLNFSSKM